MKLVVDTNVAVVANGEHEKASRQCIAGCAQQLTELTSRGTLVIDDQWRIIGEYQRHLRSSGQPGVGDAFLKWVLTNRTNPLRIDCVSITPFGDDPGNFEEFPQNEAFKGFDPDDRKFIAVSCAHEERPPVLQAFDSKWWGFRRAFQEEGIHVKFLCETDIKGIAGKA